MIEGHDDESLGSSHGDPVETMSDSTKATSSDSFSSQAFSPGSFGDESMAVTPESLMVVRNGDISMISIAQGGLSRIRRDARTSHVKLCDVVNILGQTVQKMADSQGQKLIRSGRKQARMLKGFESWREANIPLSQYLWKIVAALNKRADPCLFATDGSDLSLQREQRSIDKLDSEVSEGAGSTPSASETLQMEDNSAMARGLRCLLLALVYIDRACELNPHLFVVTTGTIHRLMLTAIYLAVKFSDDSLPQPHRWFARIGGMSTSRLSKLEAAFCTLVGFEFYVSETEFQALCMEQLRWAVRGARTQNKRSVMTPDGAKTDHLKYVF